MRELPLRLAPGADLRRELERIARERLAGGAFVVCGIGSLEHPRLRLAGRDEVTALAGPYEVLTLSGSVTPQGAHLHVSLASSTGQVVGGHVVDGNRVRTTVEVLLVELEGWTLSRAADATTGFLELQVKAAGEEPGRRAPRRG